MSKTELFVRKQSGGMYVVNPESNTTGNIWWVDSGSATGADSAGYGQNPDAPFLTLDYAIGVCTANNGDVIYAMPGHSETKAAAGSLLAHDVAGVSIIGLGEGSDRPTLTFSHTGAVTTISAANARWENLLLVCGVDSVTAPLTISASDCTLKDIEIRDAANTEFVKGITTTNAADRLHIDGLQYRGDVATGDACTEGIRLAGCDDVLIENSIFDGIASTAWVNFTVAVDNVHVRNCVFNNVGTALTKNVVDTATGSTWDAFDCWDLVGGYSFGGGSAAALASDDVSTVNTAVGTINATTTDSLHGKIGTDTEMADSSLYDMLGAVNTTTTDSINGKIGTDTEMADSSLYDLIGAAAKTTSLSTQFLALPRTVEKTDGAVLTGSDDLFTITGGPVYAQIYGIVTTIIGGASNGKLQITTTTPAATVDLNAGAVAIDNDAAGTSYYNVGATSVFTPVTQGMVILDPVTVEPTWFLLPIGTVKFNSSAAQTGVIAWYMRYIPLGENSRVVAAA